MEDEYLTRCIVDPTKKTVRLFSSEGDEKVVDCATTEEFMNVLQFVRDTVSEDVLTYVNPL